MMRGTGSRSQKEEECDDKKQQTVNSVICEPRIIFDRHFPHDIILEIFSRATIESLHACTRVSKGWIDLITDQSFIEFYQKKNNIGGHYSRKEWLDFISYHGFICGKRNKKEFAGYFLQHTIPDPDWYDRYHSIFVPFDEKNCDPSVRKWRIPEEMEILAACKQEGIVFCSDGNNYFVGMPAMAKWMIIPEPNDVDDYQKFMDDFNYIPGPEDFDFGMVVLGSNPLWYKVVKLDRKLCELYYQIYDSKISGWQKVGVVEFDDKPMTSRTGPTISISGSIYWQTINNRYVLAFNGFKDSFHLFNLTPDSFLQDVKIHDFNGRLGLSIMTDGEMELWEIYEINNNNITWHKRREVHAEDIKIRRLGECEIWYTEEGEETIIDGEHYDRIFPFGL